MVRLNSLRFAEWRILPGMEFGSRVKWWSDGNDRKEAHNGLDLRFYNDPDGRILALDRHAEVPLIYPGLVVRCVPDFLGQSIFVRHGITEAGRRLFTLYGHVVPAAGILNTALPEGAVIAALSEAGNMKVPCHLHISIALMPDSVPPENLGWKMLSENQDVTFLDPREII